VLAVFDKPDPLDGPFFEETIYVTPSRLSPAMLEEIGDAASHAASALGLTEGPVHVEMRIGDNGTVTILELAARSIGGLCARSLRFGAGVSLEELIVRHALGLGVEGLQRESQSSGVMMLPIRVAGVLDHVSGVEEARAIDGVVGVDITIASGRAVVPLPEGDRYLGFIFARGDSAENVEATLRRAESRLTVHLK
jgi:biotin carboxylase